MPACLPGRSDWASVMLAVRGLYQLMNRFYMKFFELPHKFAVNPLEQAGPFINQSRINLQQVGACQQHAQGSRKRIDATYANNRFLTLNFIANPLNDPDTFFSNGPATESTAAYCIQPITRSGEVFTISGGITCNVAVNPVIFADLKQSH